jgi:hypothetical protein
MGGQIIDAREIEARRPRLPRPRRTSSEAAARRPIGSPARRPDRPRRALDIKRERKRDARVTHAAAHDKAAVLDRDNTASDVRADTAYRSAANLALFERRGLRPQFQRKKPRGKKMRGHIAWAMLPVPG